LLSSTFSRYYIGGFFEGGFLLGIFYFILLRNRMAVDGWREDGIDVEWEEAGREERDREEEGDAGGERSGGRGDVSQAKDGMRHRRKTGMRGRIGEIGRKEGREWDAGQEEGCGAGRRDAGQEGGIGRRDGSRWDCRERRKERDRVRKWWKEKQQSTRIMASSTYVVYCMRKTPLRGRGRHQKKREGRRSDRKTVAEDGTNNEEEMQEEEVRER
jgi:hypothetical protein